MSLAAFAGFAPPIRGVEAKRRPEGEAAEYARAYHLRQRDAERIPRMLNAKQRTIGVDKAALDQQVVETREAAEAERERTALKDAEIDGFRQALELREKSAAAARRAMERHCMEYNQMHGERGPAAEAEDRRKGAMTQFAGEDLQHRVRQQRQKQQQAAWIEQQVYEKRLREEVANREHLRWGASVAAVAENMRAVEERDAILRRQIELSRMAYNEAKAAERGSKQNDEKREVEEANHAEVEHHAQDGFLNELPRTVYERTERKGDVDGIEERAYAKVNLQRVAVAKGEKENEARALVADRANDAAVLRQRVLNARAEQQQRRDMERAAMIANQALAARQHDQKVMAKVESHGAVTDDFFKQFGRALR